MQENIIIARKEGEHRQRKEQTKERQEHKQKQDKVHYYY